LIKHDKYVHIICISVNVKNRTSFRNRTLFILFESSASLQSNFLPRSPGPSPGIIYRGEERWPGAEQQTAGQVSPATWGTDCRLVLPPGGGIHVAASTRGISVHV
jgi:hypothetical protein